MKRRITAIILTISFLISLSSCTGGETESVKVEALTERQNVEYALSGYDDLGRRISPAGEGNGRLVGMFYTLWLGNYFSDTGIPYFNGIYDMSRMDFKYIYSGGGSPFTRMHFFAKPLFGYYDQRDRWVVERHVQMFIAAGLDFLAIDTTNNDYYPKPLEVLLEVLESYRLQGFKVPKIMFLTNTNSHERVTELYNFMYKDKRYEALWFCDDDNGRNKNGKPWITMRSEQRMMLSREVSASFYVRDSQWPNESFKSNGFPWIEFTRPQPVHNGVISVSVAQNSGMHMSTSVQYKNSPNGRDYYNSNWGRGYTSASGTNNSELVNEGANFQEQWDIAIASDARIAFVLGWNEWAALKLAANVEGIGQTVVFFDLANVEFSRDIEPISGHYGDNYYMQLIKNIRAFKGQTGEGIKIDRAKLRSDLISSAWNDVTSGVSDFSGEKKREYRNCDNSAILKNDTKRNDITSIRIARDNENAYVLVTTSENITSDRDEGWMNLWIRNEGFGDGSYDLVINRSREGDIANIERLSDEGSTVVGVSQMVIFEDQIQYTVPLELLSDTFEIKVTDNVDPLKNIMDLYTKGDCAPYGRLDYTFTIGV